MIISHRHRFVFFAIPKTGTHSVRQALRKQMGPDDLEQVGLFVQKRFPFPEFADIRHGHISAQQIRPVLGSAVYDGYFKFAFVRHPFDRFVSFCAFITRESGQFKADPRGVMRYVIGNEELLDRLLARPQHEFVTDASGRLDVDFLGRTETMQASYDAIAERLGLPTESLGHANSSEHRPWQEYYDAELAGLVAGHYRRDLELFGYEFDRNTA